MIPIRDTIQSKSYPIVNTLIIGANVLLYLVELSQGQGLDKFIFVYGLVPARYTSPEIASYFTFGQQALSLFSFMFIHGGFWHLLGNMWSLYIFGDNVEDRLGPFRYLLFYLLCGWASGISHLIFNLNSTIPTIGASGAIAGVMGAYFILYPTAKILTLIPIIIIPYFLEIPAFFFLGIWFVLQFLSATGSSAQASGVAWWAHVGGFILGIVFLKLFSKVPVSSLGDRLNAIKPQRKTPRLQVIRALSSSDDANLYGSITVTPREAHFGTKKMVNVQHGFNNRVLRVTVPPGMTHGSRLRLGGMGKYYGPGKRGNLFLKVLIHSWKD